MAFIGGIKRTLYGLLKKHIFGIIERSRVNNPAVGFYKKHGFFIGREIDNPIGDGFFMNDYILIRDFTKDKLK